MKVIYKTYKFRLEPNGEQKTLLSKHFGCTRFVYNHFLAERKRQYDETHKSDNYNEQARKLTEMKKSEETKWLKNINSQSLQHALRHLETAYVNFFKGKTKFPKFKSKKSRNSFTVPQFVNIKDDRVYFPKFKEGIKIRLHKPFYGKINSATISLTTTGKYYISILTEQEYEPFEKTGKCVGVDLGLKDFVVTSDGKKYKNNRYLKRYRRKLRTAQKHLSRKQYGSNGYEKQRLKVARIHEKISDCRNDNLHKVSIELVKDYDTICVENLNIKGMMKNHRLAESVSDVGWYRFLTYLKYKSEWNDKKVVEIDRFYPSSQTCSECGFVNSRVRNLSVREWVCPNCGHTHDRDVNAAKNILNEGLKNISVGTTDYTDGDSVRLANKRLSVKSETTMSST